MSGVSSINSMTIDEQKEAAFNKLMRSASASEQSSARMRKKLEAAGFCECAISFALERACEIGAIDDVRFSECLIRSTLAQGRGLSKALHEIEMLGIDVTLLESYQAYIEEGEQAEIERALELLIRHPSRSKNIRQSSYRKLISRGFSGHIASQALEQYMEETHSVIESYEYTMEIS